MNLYFGSRYVSYLSLSLVLSGICLGSWCCLCLLIRLEWWSLAAAGAADGVEVNAEMAFEQSQHCRVAALKSSASDRDRPIILAPKGFSK